VRWNFMLGAIFVAIVVFMPEGLVPGMARLSRSAWRAMSGTKKVVPVTQPAAPAVEPKP
jgi:branched-chain amino acid transport system permease protein